MTLLTTDLLRKEDQQRENPESAITLLIILLSRKELDGAIEGEGQNASERALKIASKRKIRDSRSA
jgi:hypothetical protein